MPDEGDYGQDYQARFNKASLADHQRRQAQEAQDVNISGICSWCKEEIPAARRLKQPGCSLCVQCKTIKERFPERMI